MIEHLQLRNFLSFGPESEGFDLRALNVLIGPNGSGKSNFLEGLALLAATPSASQLSAAIRRGGGIEEWAFQKNGEPARLSSISLAELHGSARLIHDIAFREHALQTFIEEEQVGVLGASDEIEVFRYELRPGADPVLRPTNGDERTLGPKDLSRSDSVLTQYRDPLSYPELTWLARQYEGIRVYRQWIFGPDAPVRKAQSTTLPTDELLEDCSNLALVLNRLREEPESRAAIRRGLSDLDENFKDFHVRILGGTALLVLEETHGKTVAPRISDGTLRYLALLALLCDPEPPAFIAIEEPELGLHPDLLLSLAELLKAASERTQIVVTTHSEMLVSCFSDSPEDVVVCEKIEGETYLERLDADKVGQWLDEDHQLGELWTRGDLGGNRWG